MHSRAGVGRTPGGGESAQDMFASPPLKKTPETPLARITSGGASRSELCRLGSGKIVLHGGKLVTPVTGGAGASKAKLAAVASRTPANMLDNHMTFATPRTRR